MAVKVAINGFGRIGRLAFRQMFGAEGYEVVAINDLTSPKMLAHLLKYDSSQGKYALADKVTAGEDSITVDGKEIKIYAKANAEELPWGEIGVDVVLECTGFYTSKAKAEAHIKAGARKVVISAPAGNDGVSAADLCGQSVLPICILRTHGRAHAYLRRGTTGDFGRIGWIMSENRGIGRMHIGLMMDLVISFKITEQKLKS